MAIKRETVRICQRALVVALIVGTVLNLINQGREILTAQHVDFVKILLTYLVPFFVSCHGALSVGAGTGARPRPDSTGETAA